MQHTHSPGRHELGQNFLVDRAVARRVSELVAARPGPIVEWGTGNGALTTVLAALGRKIEGVEIDAKRARALDRKTGPHVSISEGDILRHGPPVGAVVVSNVPFHLTTPVLRHLLAQPSWTAAVLITQWEVARKRAGVGGATQLTGQWWPWFEFTLDRRIPAHAFRPRPSVDAGLLVIDRRADPLVHPRDLQDYQRWVAGVFRGRGRGITDILAGQGVPRPAAQRIVDDVGGRRGPVLPRDLTASAWAEAYAARRTARGVATRPRTGRTAYPKSRRRS